MNHCCKIGRIIDEFDLTHGAFDEDINKYLLARYLGQGEYEETGVRPLKDWFNLKLLKTVYSRNGRYAIETQIESDYEILDSGDEIKKDAVIQDLKDDGIDTEKLLNSFATTSTMYRHLTNCLEGKKEKKKNEESDWEKNKIQYIQKSMRENTKDALRSLENKDRLQFATDAEVFTPVILGCPECSTQVRFEKALQQGYICEDHMMRPNSIEEETESNSEHTKRNEKITG